MKLSLSLILAAAALAGAGPARADDETCLGCHTGGSLAPAVQDVDAAALKGSIHGRSGLSCTDCHASLAGVADFPHGEVAEPACGTCHGAAETKAQASVHKAAGGPRCWTCHGDHDVLPASDPASKVAPLNLPRTCLPCHADPAFARQHDLQPRERADLYERGVHHKQLVEGNPMAPTCSTCHGSHDITSHRDPSSPIARGNVPSTCGGCHSDVLSKFEASVHGKDLAGGNPDVPTCLGCHGEHAIRDPQDPQSAVAPQHVAQTCSHCHDDARLAATYGFTPSKLRTYIGSYHGVANKFGEPTVANCASCHGAHDILPSTDKASMIHPDNLARTCGTCHPQAGRNFAQGKIHVENRPEDNYWAFTVRRLYLALIYVVIGQFVAFILVDLWWRLRRRFSGAGAH